MMLSTRLPLLAGGRFDPRSTGSGSLKLWLDASRLGLNDGDQVATWPDLSGSGNDASQATASKRPLYKVGQFGSLPGVKFDGVDDFLAVTIARTQPYTLCVVAKAVSATTPYLFDGATVFSGFLRYSSPNLTMGATGNISVAASPTVAHVYSCTFAGAASSFAIDGSVATGTVSGDTTALTLGCIGDTTGHFWNGPIAAVLLYARALATGERQALERWLGSQWGVAVS